MEDISDTDGEQENVTSTNERTPLLPEQPRNHRRTRTRSSRRTRRRAPTVDSVGESSLAPSSSSQNDQQQQTTPSALVPVAATVVAAVRNVFSLNSDSRQTRVVTIDVNQSLPSPSGQYSVNCDDDLQVNPNENQSPDNGPAPEVVQVEMNHPTEETTHTPRQQRSTPRRRADNIV